MNTITRTTVAIEAGTIRYYRSEGTYTVAIRAARCCEEGEHQNQRPEWGHLDITVRGELDRFEATVVATWTCRSNHGEVHGRLAPRDDTTVTATIRTAGGEEELPADQARDLACAMIEVAMERALLERVTRHYSAGGAASAWLPGEDPS